MTPQSDVIAFPSHALCTLHHIYTSLTSLSYPIPYHRCYTDPFQARTTYLPSNKPQWIKSHRLNPLQQRPTSSATEKATNENPRKSAISDKRDLSARLGKCLFDSANVRDPLESTVRGPPCYTSSTVGRGGGRGGGEVGGNLGDWRGMINLDFNLN